MRPRGTHVLFQKMTAGSKSLLPEDCGSEPWEGHNPLCTEILEEVSITLPFQCPKISLISIYGVCVPSASSLLKINYNIQETKMTGLVNSISFPI